MKLRTQVDEAMSRSNMGDVDHDRKAAHALMQAMEEIELDGYQDDEMEDVHRRAFSDTRMRASELMRSWGFDSGEADSGR
jgi:hypothetical protein